MSRGQPMSMEAMLDEERREILALLEGTSVPKNSYASAEPMLGARASSPYASPRSPVRSMLDIGDDSASISSVSGVGAKRSPPRPQGPVRSMLDFDAPPPPPAAPAPVRSMLDFDSPPPPPLRKPQSGPTSPVETGHRNSYTSPASNVAHPRSMSDSSSKPTPANFGPRSSASRLDPTSEFQFGDIITTQTGQGTQSLPKRNTQGGRRSGVMADVMRGNDISLPGDRGRHHSIAVANLRSNNKGSRSPHNRLGMRSSSPSANLLSASLNRVTPGGNMMMLDDGRMVDLNSAYRKLSDANLVYSGSTLANVSGRKKSAQDDDEEPGRLQKDYRSPDGDEILDDSSEDDHHSSSEDEGERGRDMAPRAGTNSSEDGSVSKSPSGAGKGGRKIQSLLAAAEEERAEIASLQPKYQYKSLLEPAITVTNPQGEKTKKKGVHPTTNYDHGPASGNVSDANESEKEYELSNIKEAQRLSFAMTPIISQNEHHRAIRMIYRGEWQKIVKSLEEEHQRIRKYLVATDLSDESTHALEWAIGTVLRDGDTLLAIYCVDEETGIVSGDGSVVPDDPKAMREQAAAISTVANSKSPPPLGTTHTVGSGISQLHRMSMLSTATSDSSHTAGGSVHGHHVSMSRSPAPSTSRDRNKGEEERFRAVKDISDRVTRLLRKTQLQVRVVVEVIHCKNPKHLITEIIDHVSPTLVILGSRGRSALKGVILGSFSNYLVTKSSVPVMVARKRLRKQGKYKRPPVRQVNNLSNPTARSLTNARID